MRYSLFSALALSLSAVVQAEISSPSAGAQWPVEQNQQITWDTTGLTPPINIHLVPAGAVDITVIVAEIAIGVSNTGSFTWAPDSTISTSNVEIIIIDTKQVIVISEVFEIIIIEVTSTKKLTTPTKTSTVLKLSTVTKLATVTTQPLTLVLTQTLVKTVSSLVTTKPTTTTLNTIITATSIKATTLTTPTILITATKPLNTTSTKLTTTALGIIVTTTSKPLTTSTSTKALNTSTSSIRVNTTAVAVTSKATFTGAATHLASSNTYSLISGGLLGLIAMVFL